MSPKLNYENVLATLPLFIAIGGASAFAASQLGKNSVGSKQLKRTRSSRRNQERSGHCRQDQKWGPYLNPPFRFTWHAEGLLSSRSG
jgi:hypothetical protein